MKHDQYKLVWWLKRVAGFINTHMIIALCSWMNWFLRGGPWSPESLPSFTLIRRQLRYKDKMILSLRPHADGFHKHEDAVRRQERHSSSSSSASAAHTQSYTESLNAGASGSQGLTLFIHFYSFPYTFLVTLNFLCFCCWFPLKMPFLLTLWLIATT